MQHFHKIKKGLDLKLEGEAPKSLKSIPASAVYALRPDDFKGVKPKMLVKEGDLVKIGTPLFTDKQSRTIQFVSPVSGKVKSIERGERRKILYIHIESDNKQEQAPRTTLPNLKTATAQELVKTLCQNGLLAFIKQRPYDVTVETTSIPRDIFVSAFNSMPLAQDFSFVVESEKENFIKGLEVLNSIAPTHLGCNPQQEDLCQKAADEGIDAHIFDGPNPSGNVGVQINHIAPINKGDMVWTIGAEEVLFIGRLFRSNELDFSRTIAVAGSEITEPTYVRTIIGAPLQDILKGRLKHTEHIRIINGNPLVGRQVEISEYTGAHNTEVCVIPEGDDKHEAFGWILPRLKDYSAHRSYFSWLQGKEKAYKLDCRIKGGKRHMIMSGEYDKVFPMDIYAGYLIKAILTGNIDKQEELGIYEVAPEDFAVAEFIDSSKLELQRIVREGLDILRKENA